MRAEQHFIVYKHNFIMKDGKLVTKQFIALKYQDDTLQFTDFHKYIKSPTHRVKKFTDDGNTRFKFVVKFLNYAFFTVGISKLDDISVEIVRTFLNAYGMCTLPSDTENTRRAEDTVKRCVRTVMDFLEIFIDARVGQCHMNKDDLYKFVNKRDKHGKVIRAKEPAFDVNYTGSSKSIFRDIPNTAFDMLLRHIATNHQELLGLVMLSAFAGLRPSEACNVRRLDSPLGPGIIFDIANGELLKIRIDLLSEMNLRSDLRSVGRIKKERMALIPDIFLRAFRECYDLYMKYLEGKKYEKDYGAFTINKQGRAMTYDSYRGKFQKIIEDEMIPMYLSSNDIEMVIYGRTLMEHQLSPHIFRHWFTVQLILSGISEIGMLMHYRGDTSPESALTYLQNKGELEKQYNLVNNEMFKYYKWASKKVVESE